MVNVIVLILIIIFRKLYDFGIVFEDWKIVNIILVFKKGKRFDVVNYRLILLICIVCKLMEYILISYIMKYVNDYNILYGL